jgi:inner membrane protein
MEPHLNPLESTLGAIRSSHVLRILAVAFLALLLRIPISMVDGLIRERQERRDEAVAEVSAKWGREQSVIGPALVVPYLQRTEITSASGKTITQTTEREVVILPARLAAKVRLGAEERSRGIFSVPVYRANVELRGEIAKAPVLALGIDPASVAWDRAQLVVGISDARAIQNAAAVTWNGQAVALRPGVGAQALTAAGIHAPVDASGPGDRFSFALPLVLNGSVGLSFAPLGEQTSVSLEASAGSPSFQGAWLPTVRNVAASDFSATWEIPSLGRNYPQSWLASEDRRADVEASRFGVALVSPVDQYRMAERSVKYAGLFILLTFATVWLIEVLARIHVHPIQYLLLGSALCVFYLLELSLAEHLGFGLSYAIASCAIVAMVGAYGFVVFRRAGWAIGIATGVAALYGYLFVLLRNEDFALLIGSIGLFAVLAGVMFATRNVDWYAIGGTPRTEASE